MSRHDHIATLIKPHGFKGGMVIRGTAGDLQKLKKGTPLFIGISEQRVPFFIESFDPDPTSESGIIKLEFIDSEIDARKYTGLKVYAELKPASTASENANGPVLIGYSVIDNSSARELTVVDFLDQPENPLLVLDHEGEEVLLPLNADYILAVRTREKRIEVDFPEGYFD